MQNKPDWADQTRTIADRIMLALHDPDHENVDWHSLMYAQEPAKPSWPMRPAPAICTVYFIGPVGGPIKIGMASRVDVRVRDLRLANAYPLEVWATVEGPPSLERDYHRRFAAHRLHGEWFARCPDILAEIERLAA